MALSCSQDLSCHFPYIWDLHGDLGAHPQLLVYAHFLEAAQTPSAVWYTWFTIPRCLRSFFLRTSSRRLHLKG